MTLNQNYDIKLKTNLEKRLNRLASNDELINADKDSDLVNEVLWELIVDLEQRIINIEKKVL